MKILVIGNEDRYRKYMPDLTVIKNSTIVFLPLGIDDNEILENAWDCDAVIADPMAEVSAELINKMPNLKIIQSEAVGFNNFDCEAAKMKGIYVCNCKGANADAVAEQTILLMLGLLRSIIIGDREERAGNQMAMKERLMYEGLTELSDCKVGLIGFGDIAKATAKRLAAFNCEVVYNKHTKVSEDIEKEYNVSYTDIDTLLSECDIVSIHCPVTNETTNMVDAEFLFKMKKTAYLINTARGEIVDNEALYNAIITDGILGAGLDTVAPEPTTKDNILLNLPEEYKDRIIFSPHVGGISTAFFRRAHSFDWQNVEKALQGETPKYIVNNVPEKKSESLFAGREK